MASNPHPLPSCKAGSQEPSCSRADVSSSAFPGGAGAQLSHTDRYFGGFTVGFVQAEETELKHRTKQEAVKYH